MNAADLLGWLLEATAASSAALLLVLALRAPLRRRFGSTLVYAAWGLPLAALAAVWLPAPVAPVAATTVATITLASGSPRAAVVGADAGFPVWICAAWLAGVLALAAWTVLRQRRFLRRLGRLRRRDDGCYQAAAVAGLPATLGVWRPRIVLPADFESRYTDRQRALMLAHERAHIAHGDLLVNAGAALLRCVFWFNPLLHVAMRCLRHDQELACDQRVLARHPHSRRAYGEAMFHTQLAAQASPLGCHWGYGHPLKERIEMLKQPVPTLSRWLGGAALVTALGLVTIYSAWAAQPSRTMVGPLPANAQAVRAELSLEIAGASPHEFVMVAADGAPMVFSAEHDGQTWRVAARASERDKGWLDFSAEISRDGRVVSAPQLVVREGEPAAIRIDDMALELLLTTGRAAELAPPPPQAPPPPPAPAAAPLPPLPAPPAPPSPAAPPALALSQPVMPALATPAYPETALKQGIEGKVVLLVDIDAQGKPTAIEVAQSEPAGVFDDAAKQAAWQWRFTPAIENGHAVASRIRVPLEFRNPPKGSGMPAGVDMPALEATEQVQDVTCDAIAGWSGSERTVCIES